MFYGQVNMDDQDMDLVKSIIEDTPSSSKLLSNNDMVLDKKRKNKSLAKLTLKFVDLLQNTMDGKMNLNKVIDLLLLLLFV